MMQLVLNRKQAWWISYRIGIHIADVSEYVKIETKLDLEAKRRTTSYYYAVDNSPAHIPMLPFKLSNDICSLIPEKDRLCLSVIFVMNKNGQVVKSTELKANYKELYKITRVKNKFKL